MFDALTTHPGVAVLLVLIFSLVLFRLYRSSTGSSQFQREVTKRQRLTPNVVYRYGVVEIKGRRPYMEDRHVEVGMLHGDPTQSLYCVFDGHGGARASEFCCDRIPHNVLSSPHFAAGDVGKALTDGFLRTDDEFMELALANHYDDGTTLICACARGADLFVANAGDSRALLVQRSGKVVPLSDDHKPNRKDEMARIKACGGAVYFHGVWRVQGILAVSRAVGDRILKAYVTAEPDVRQWHVTSADKFLVLATDGLWDVMSNEEVGDLLVAMTDPQEAAARLVEYAFNRGSTDNITVVVVDVTQQQAVGNGAAGGAGSAGAGAYPEDKTS